MASTACAGAGERGADAGDASARGEPVGDGDDADMALCAQPKGDVVVSHAEAPLRSTPLYAFLSSLSETQFIGTYKLYNTLYQ